MVYNSVDVVMTTWKYVVARIRIRYISRVPSVTLHLALARTCWAAEVAGMLKEHNGQIKR